MVIYRQEVPLKTRVAGWAFFGFMALVCLAAVVVAFSGDWATLGSLILGVPFALVGLRYAVGTMEYALEGEDLIRVGRMGSVPTFPVRIPLADYRALRVVREPGMWVIELVGEQPFQLDGLADREAAEAVARSFSEALDLPLEG